MNKLILILVGIFGMKIAQSQQIFQTSEFRDINFSWNPAMTATADYGEVYAAYRREWAGFEGAPQTTSVGASYPFLDHNMSVGGFFTIDRIQPVQNITIGGTYAYHLKLGIRNNDRLSLGLMGTINQFSMNAVDIRVVDPDDVNIPIGERTTFNFNGGAGFYYVSHDNINSLNSYFFVGAAVNQALPVDVFIENREGVVNFKRAIHGNATVGGRVIADYYFIEPYLWLNHAYPNVFNLNLGVNMEFYEIAWGGLAYNTNKSVAFQAGYILKDWVLQQHMSLRIGGLARVNTGTSGQARGMTYEFYFGYRVDL